MFKFIRLSSFLSFVTLTNLCYSTDELSFKSSSNTFNQSSKSSNHTLNILDDSIVLQTIYNVETHNKYWKIGTSGEQTRYQFCRDTWREYSKVNFFTTNQKSTQLEADRVAIAHLTRIKLYLAKNGYDINIKNIGWIWNAGFGAFNKRVCPASTKNHIRKLTKEYIRLMKIQEVQDNIEFQKRMKIQIVLNKD